MELLIKEERYDECYKMIDEDKYSPQMEDLLCCVRMMTHKSSELVKLYQYIIDFLPEYPTVEQLADNINNEMFEDSFYYAKIVNTLL